MEREKTQVHSGILTHVLLVVRDAFYRCATTTILSLLFIDFLNGFSEHWVVLKGKKNFFARIRFEKSRCSSFFPFNKFQSRAGINFLVSFSATEIASNGLFQTSDYENCTILDMLRPNGNAAKSLKFTILGFIVWLLLATTVKADMSIEGALKESTA